MKEIRTKIVMTLLALGGVALAFACMGEKEVEKPKAFTIHTIGDSTMAAKVDTARPEMGWAECIESHIVDTTKVKIVNYAKNGRSSKSFINEGRWEEVKKNIKNGDYVFIQFGHNDQKIKDTIRYTNSSTIYKENLRKFVRESKELGATPILFTSIVRRNFNEAGTLVDTHGNYPDAMRQVASEMNVTLVDAQLITEKLVIAYGPEESKRLYNHVEAGHENYPNGRADDTHLNTYGAKKITSLLIESVREKDARLARALK